MQTDVQAAADPAQAQSRTATPQLPTQLPDGGSAAVDAPDFLEWSGLDDF